MIGRGERRKYMEKLARWDRHILNTLYSRQDNRGTAAFEHLENERTGRNRSKFMQRIKEKTETKKNTEKNKGE